MRLRFLHGCSPRIAEFAGVGEGPPAYTGAREALLHRNITGASSEFIQMSHSNAVGNGGSASPQEFGDAPAQPGFWALTIGSIGVVYGDIGTSPLYALREVRAGGDERRRARPTEPVVLGILSLIIWALMFVVTVEIRAHPAARRQQGRGRHARADGARPARARPRAPARSSCSASSAARCSTATRSSRRRCRCSRRSKA